MISNLRSLRTAALASSLVTLASGAAMAADAQQDERMAREVAERYCDAYVAHDGNTLASLYLESASTEPLFQDPVFGPLDSLHTRAMWRMLMLKPQDLVIKCEITSQIGRIIRIAWTADYLFSFGPSPRQVNNVGTTVLKIVDGKIVQQTDSFDLCRWTNMALGDVAGDACRDPQAKLRPVFLGKLEQFIKATTPPAK